MTIFALLPSPIDAALAKRAAIRIGASVAVMSALGAISREEPRDETPLLPTIRAATAEPSALLPRIVLAGTAGEKTDRLHRTVPPTVLAADPARFAARPEDGVLFFDRCLPSCESRDPLLPGRWIAENEPESERRAQPETFAAPSSPEPARTSSEQSRVGILDRMSSSISVAARSGRTIVGEAGQILSW